MTTQSLTSAEQLNSLLSASLKQRAARVHSENIADLPKFKLKLDVNDATHYVAFDANGWGILSDEATAAEFSQYDDEGKVYYIIRNGDHLHSYLSTSRGYVKARWWESAEPWAFDGKHLIFSWNQQALSVKPAKLTYLYASDESGLEPVDVSLDALKVVSKIWESDGTTYQFPEQQLSAVMNRPNVGLCFSGGGTRAMSAAMGQMRALDHLGLMPHVRYISCVSGGSWASSIYTYYKSGAANDAALLGPVTFAHDITDEYIAQPLSQSLLASGSTKWMVRIQAEWIAGLVDGKYNTQDLWNYSIGQMFLEQFGLFDSDQAAHRPDQMPYFSYDSATVAQIKLHNPHLADSCFVTARPDRPYLVINSTVLLPQNKPSEQDNLGFEYTPLTAGRPLLTDYQGTQYGGGFIEPFAYSNGAPADAPTDNKVTMPRLNRPFSLVDATGTSSSAFAGVAADHDITSLDPRAYYWGINRNGPYEGKSTIFGDGGIIDNYGIISLLLRGVKNIVVFINTQSQLDCSYVPTEDPKNRCDAWLPALFGYSDSSWAYSFPTNYVFESAGFAAVFDQLKACKTNGKPLIASCEHTTVKNTAWGLAGGEKINVVWYYLDRCTAWECALGSSNIRAEIQAGNATSPSGPFEHFPNYKTIDENTLSIVRLTDPQVKLLADFTCDTILMDDQHLIQQLISSVETGNAA